MCNAHNHPPECMCGWGSDGHLGRSSFSGGWRGISPRSEAWPSLFPNWSPGEELRRPSACPYCGEMVYFVRHNGGCVWFDELGWPWPKHSCFEPNVSTMQRPSWSQDRIAQDTTSYIRSLARSVPIDQASAQMGLVVVVESCMPKILGLSVMRRDGTIGIAIIEHELAPAQLLGSIVLLDRASSFAWIVVGDRCLSAWWVDRPPGWWAYNPSIPWSAEGLFVRHTLHGVGVTVPSAWYSRRQRLQVAFVGRTTLDFDARTPDLRWLIGKREGPVFSIGSGESSCDPT